MTLRLDTGAAAAPLPETVTVDTPGQPLRLAIPKGLCTFPVSVVEQFSRAMSGLHLLLAAGDCTDIANLSSPGDTVRFSILVSMLDRDFDRTTRVPKSTHLRECFEQFPAKRDDLALNKEIEDFHSKGTGLQIGEIRSLGLLRTTRDAVIGGSLMRASRNQRSATIIQITACLAPASIPIIWLFQRTFDPNTDAKIVVQMVHELTASALAQIERTGNLK